ncbi:MAG: PQQ-dependent sugar dehydrogenase, partial [Saprospiraceae bacterium]|nr:PQQ-dependent sugar dehydrogenase [Saprospiraceae bacterium]
MGTMRHLMYFILFTLLYSHPHTLWSQLPPGFGQRLLAENLDPTSMAIAPDGRIFITEKEGLVRIVRDGQLLDDPFLRLEVDNFNERGLGSIAFHPEFEHNNYVYVFYTVPEGDFNRISRFTANGDYAIPGSEEVMLELDRLSGTIHNGGAMAFGPDGKLYIATGDGADPANSQTLSNLLGKILRINDDGTIPEDNPFYEQATGDNRAIWSLGFRNPFSFAIQESTGRIFVNDVGSEFWEEVNAVERGSNHGWPIIEGERTMERPPDNYRDPLYTYDHDEGCSVIGAAFCPVEHTLFPGKYRGRYFFADYCGGYIKVLDPETGELVETFATDIDRPINLLFDQEGNLYYLERKGIGGGSAQDNTSTSNGQLWKVFFTGSGSPLISSDPASVLLAVGEDAT